MNNIFKPILAALILIMAFGCKKDKGDSHRRFTAPDWAISETGAYPYSMTVVVKVPEEIKQIVTESDKTGAFINNECRGVGVLVKANDSYVIFVQVRGTASEQGKVYFRFYDSGTSYLYQTDGAIDYGVDEIYGTVDQPALLSLVQVEEQ